LYLSYQYAIFDIVQSFYFFVFQDQFLYEIFFLKDDHLIHVNLQVHSLLFYNVYYNIEYINVDYNDNIEIIHHVFDNHHILKLNQSMVDDEMKILLKVKRFFQEKILYHLNNVDAK